MKVCAHIVLGPFNLEHKRFHSAGAAVEYFVEGVAGTDFGTGTDEQVMDLYPQCDSCTSDMNFHDYPMRRLSVNPNGGIEIEKP